MNDGNEDKGLGSVAWDARRSDLRKRLITAAVLSLVALIVLVGCSGDTGRNNRRQPGWATVRFDGTLLSAHPRSISGIDSSRESDTGGASLIERRDRWFGPDGGGDWRPRGGGPKAFLRLEMMPSQDGAASVEFSIDTAVYRSDNPTKVEPGWRKGRAVFRDVPLVSGEPYRGKSSLKRLVVEWQCRKYQPDG
jgi:hypothetical protein